MEKVRSYTKISGDKEEMTDIVLYSLHDILYDRMMLLEVIDEDQLPPNYDRLAGYIEGGLKCSFKRLHDDNGFNEISYMIEHDGEDGMLVFAVGTELHEEKTVTSVEISIDGFTHDADCIEIMDKYKKFIAPSLKDLDDMVVIEDSAIMTDVLWN